MKKPRQLVIRDTTSRRKSGETRLTFKSGPHEGIEDKTDVFIPPGKTIEKGHFEHPEPKRWWGIFQKDRRTGEDRRTNERK